LRESGNAAGYCVVHHRGWLMIFYPSHRCLLLLHVVILTGPRIDLILLIADQLTVCPFVGNW
jgi:hypothetical protein